MTQELHTVDSVLSSFDEIAEFEELDEFDLLCIQYIKDNYSTEAKTWEEWFEVLVEANGHAARTLIKRQKEKANEE